MEMRDRLIESSLWAAEVIARAIIWLLALLLFGLLFSRPSAGQLRGPVRNLTADTTPAAGDMLLVDKATPLVSRKLTLHALAGYLMTDPDLVPATRTITCTPPLLCAGGTSMDLSTDRTLSLSPANTTIASAGQIQWSVTGATPARATNEGMRNALFSLFNSNTSANDGAVFTIDTIQRSHTATITRTGFHCASYTEADNGGDTSCILAVSTGGGPGATVAKLSGLRPAGFTDQSGSSGPALEVHTSDMGPALYLIPGSNIGSSPHRSQGLIIGLGQSAGATQSGGIVVQPLDGIFDTRDAFTIGTASLGASPVNVKFQLFMNGNLTSVGSGTFASIVSPTIAGSTSSAGTLTLQSTTHATKGKIIFGSSAYDEVNNRLGIDWSSPDSPLAVSLNAVALPAPLTGSLIHIGNADTTGSVFASDSFAAANTYACRRANTTNASPSALAANDIICNFAAYGYGAAAYGSTPGAAIRPTADQTWTGSAQGTRIDFSTDDLNTTSLTTKLSISAMGHLTHTQTTAPTVACTGTGTSPSAPTIDTGGTDHKFTVVINTGTGSPGSTGTCTITFATAFPAARPIVCMLVKGATAWGNSSTIMETTESASAPVFTWTNIASGTPTSLTTSTSYKFSCVGDF